MDMALVDKVTMELDTVKMLFERMREMPPAARDRVLRYVEALLERMREMPPAARDRVLRYVEALLGEEE